MALVYCCPLDGLIASILFICMSLWIKASAKRLNVKQKTMLVTAQVLYINLYLQKGDLEQIKNT